MPQNYIMFTLKSKDCVTGHWDYNDRGVFEIANNFLNILNIKKEIPAHLHAQG